MRFEIGRLALTETARWSVGKDGVVGTDEDTGWFNQ